MYSKLDIKLFVVNEPYTHGAPKSKTRMNVTIRPQHD